MALVVLALDQISKYWVRTCIPEGQSVALVPGLLYLTRVRNYGAAFGILNYQTGLFVLIGLAVLTGLGLALAGFARQRQPLLSLALALAWGGAAGNLVDRLYLGYVVDFLDLRFWPVFNLADVALVAGMILLGWQVVRQTPEEEQVRHGDRQ
ncbi:MAG: signal peptidase II [Moorellales bacterium]